MYTALVGLAGEFKRVSFPDCNLLPPKSNLSLQCYENVSMYSDQILTARSQSIMHTCSVTVDCSLLICSVETTSACTCDGYRSCLSSQPVHQDATLIRVI